MVAMELCEGGDPHQPAAELTGRIVARAREKGLILLSCGSYGNVIRILVPLTVPDEQLQQGLDILAECFDELAGRPLDGCVCRAFLSLKQRTPVPCGTGVLFAHARPISCTAADAESWRWTAAGSAARRSAARRSGSSGRQ